MKITFYATWDGEVFRPEEPLPWEPGTRVRVSVEMDSSDQEEAADGPRQRVSFLKAARSLELDGPPDWSSRIGHYGPE